MKLKIIKNKLYYNIELYNFLYKFKNINNIIWILENEDKFINFVNSKFIFMDQEIIDYLISIKYLNINKNFFQDI